MRTSNANTTCILTDDSLLQEDSSDEDSSVYDEDDYEYDEEDGKLPEIIPDYASDSSDEVWIKTFYLIIERKNIDSRFTSLGNIKYRW